MLSIFLPACFTCSRSLRHNRNQDVALYGRLSFVCFFLRIYLIQLWQPSVLEGQIRIPTIARPAFQSIAAVHFVPFRSCPHPRLQSLATCSKVEACLFITAFSMLLLARKSKTVDHSTMRTVRYITLTNGRWPRKQYIRGVDDIKFYLWRGYPPRKHFFFRVGPLVKVPLYREMTTKHQDTPALNLPG